MTGTERDWPKPHEPYISRLCAFVAVLECPAVARAPCYRAPEPGVTPRAAAAWRRRAAGRDVSRPLVSAPPPRLACSAPDVCAPCNDRSSIERQSGRCCPLQEIWMRHAELWPLPIGCGRRL